MRLHDARPGGDGVAIVFLAHILPIGQEYQCQRLGDQYAPDDRV